MNTERFLSNINEFEKKKKINKAAEMYSYSKSLQPAPTSKPLRAIHGGNSTEFTQWEVPATFPLQPPLF